MAVETVLGLHVPFIEFVEVSGKMPGVCPAQYGPKAMKVGVALAFTKTLIVVVEAHCPAVGVKV